jgi:hypothetical protein
MSNSESVVSFIVIHANGSQATANFVYTPAPNGSSVSFPDLLCSCGYPHTLTGTQQSDIFLGGNIVDPPDDPSDSTNTPSGPTGAKGPSWTGTVVTPGP